MATRSNGAGAVAKTPKPEQPTIITPNRLQIRAMRDLGLSTKQWSAAKIFSVQHFVGMMAAGLTHQVMLAWGFRDLEQLQVAKEVAVEILQDPKASTENRIRAGEMLAVIMKADRDLKEQLSEFSEKTGEKATVEPLQLNKPPPFSSAVQVNVHAAGATVTKKELPNSSG